MSKTTRILIALAVILLDSLIFFIPVSAFFLAYIIIFSPPWFINYIENQNDSKVI